ncbi:MAG: hypothetical protein INH41_13965 [Myxococcaceae bacterium]|jgi:hypothetical protein|nr:hypothetical protein [Myxococcaceae bacterium]
MLRLVFVAPLLALAGCGPTAPSADAGVPLLTCDAMAAEVTLSGRLQAELFDRQCRSCHNAASASNGDYSAADRTAAAVARPTRIAAPLLPVRPGVLSESVLWLKMNGRTAGPKGEALGGVMPPGGKLDDATLKLVKDWICTGAK